MERLNKFLNAGEVNTLDVEHDVKAGKSCVFLRRRKTLLPCFEMDVKV